MEGLLLTPPDKGTIIGRAVWKARYVVVGSPHRDKRYAANVNQSQTSGSSRGKDSKGPSSKSQYTPPVDAVYLSLYKSKEDWEPIQQHSMASITECEVQMIAHRKQGPVLPTLVIQISPDPMTDKLRKRRSSRTAGLTTTKESGPTTLWFRPGDEQFTLHDWARCICAHIQPRVPDSFPLSPTSPGSPTFINPFAPRLREAAELYSRPSSRNPENSRPILQQMHSSKTVASRERRPTYSSESTSVHSRKSDVSSHASSMLPGAMNFIAHGQQYAAVRPTDIPSPATTTADYPSDYMLGWTSAQGRSSAVSSPIRGRESISSQGLSHIGADSSSPPGPRETILDRAFQLRVIPGSERDLPGEEKLSSLARFEAIMRDVESRMTQKKQESIVASPMTSAWEEDDSDEDEDTNDELEEEEDDDTDEDGFTEDLAAERSQRALAFLNNRHSAISHGRNSTLSYHSDGRPLESNPSILRPHTAHSKSRPSMVQRIGSDPHFGQQPSRRPLEDSHVHPQEERQSFASVKRLSLNDFSKRLSSSSSLLLVQTNASNNSSQVSTEHEAGPAAVGGALQPRVASRTSYDRDLDGDRDDRRRWRNSVSVMSGDGNFV